MVLQRFALLVAASLTLVACAAASGPPPIQDAKGGDPPSYTFGWPLGTAAPKPRGGTTRGAPVTLDTEPSSAWKALQEPGLSPQERDRRAILAMAGAYRVGFDFIEVDTFGTPSKAPAPYQSWGTEKVYVDRNDPGFVSLVHILEMRVVDQGGKVGEPMVVKHWRQDWAYEPSTIVEYKGLERWQQRPLADRERRGAWVQTVTQVDESPRYASVGHWQHNASFSTWISDETWRPLPRREWSVRKDYQVLLGTNRHTVNPTGWTQEENNLKAVVNEQRQVDVVRPYRSREYGVARYERLKSNDTDFAEADRYFARTQVFWDKVRDAWSAAFAKGPVTLRGQVDQLGLFMPLFQRADEIDETSAPPTAADDALIRKTLGDMGALP